MYSNIATEVNGSSGAQRMQDTITAKDTLYETGQSLGYFRTVNLFAFD